MKNYAFFLTAEVDWEDFGENEPKQLFQPLVALIKKERAFDPALTMIRRLSETIEVARTNLKWILRNVMTILTKSIQRNATKS